MWCGRNQSRSAITLRGRLRWNLNKSWEVNLRRIRIHFYLSAVGKWMFSQCINDTLEGSWTHVYIADVFASLTTEMSSALLCKYQLVEKWARPLGGRWKWSARRDTRTLFIWSICPQQTSVLHGGGNGRVCPSSSIKMTCWAWYEMRRVHSAYC